MSGKRVGRAILVALALLFALRLVQLKGKGLLHVATPRGSLAPSVEEPLLGGGRFRLADERGHPVVLVFWAPWCGPCRQELPGVERVFNSWPHRRTRRASSPSTPRAIATTRSRRRPSSG